MQHVIQLCFQLVKWYFVCSFFQELSGGNEDVLKFNFNRLKPSSSAGLPSGGASSKSGSDSE